MLAVVALWVGGGLFIILAAAARGSILISLSERGGVEVTSEGVRRIFKPGREEFFPRQLIAGLVPRPQGGVILVDSANSRRMVIPRSIEGYRDCIGELKAMGVERLPATAQNLGLTSRKRTLFEWAYLVFSICVWGVYFRNEGTHLVHRVTGCALVPLLVLGVVLEERKSGKRQWAAWGIVAAVIIALAGHW
jgi:hypothetical protein